MGFIYLLPEHFYARQFGLPAVHNWGPHVGRGFILSEIRSSSFGRQAPVTHAEIDK
jgi:hypothetical protein